MNYCSNCICWDCKIKRAKNEREKARIEKAEILKRNRERAWELKYSLTICDNHFPGVTFKHGFKAMKLEHASWRHFSVRLANVLYNGGFKTVGDVLNSSEIKFLRQKNVGKKSLEELIRFFKTGVHDVEG